MDLIPNLPVTKRGNRHLLVVVDYFTKWAEVFPLPDMRAETITSVFLGEIVARYGTHAPCRQIKAGIWTVTFSETSALCSEFRRHA